MKSWLMGVAAAIALSSGAQAASRIDVDNLTAPPKFGETTGTFAGSAIDTAGQWRGTVTAFQTWTVGSAGRLSQIDLMSLAVSTLSLDGVTFIHDRDYSIALTVLRGGTLDAPGSVKIGSVSRMASDTLQMGVLSFDLSSLNILAAAGDMLTFRMSVEACPEVYFCGRAWNNFVSNNPTPSDYAGGAAFSTNDGGGFYLRHDTDMNFRTWMSAVPEPSTWAMMIVGFGLAGAALRRGGRPALVV